MIDPIDGTQNFVNGLPIYSSSIAVLRHGQPVAGAIWGASTHRLSPGIYHSRSGGPLSFNNMSLGIARPTRGQRRGLGAMPPDEDQHLRPDPVATQTADRLRHENGGGGKKGGR